MIILGQRQIILPEDCAYQTSRLEGRRCIKKAGHRGIHFDGTFHVNTPDTWTPLTRQRKENDT